MEAEEESTDTATLLSSEHTSSWREAGLAQPSYEREDDDGRDHLRRLCYIRTNMLVESVVLPENCFTARGYLSFFWKDPDFAEGKTDVKRGSVETPGVYQKVMELEDTGATSQPINPHNIFTNQLSLSRPSPPKLLFDDKRGIVHYEIPFKAVLSCKFNLQNFPFDRSILTLQLNFRSGSWKLAPTAFDGVPAKWHLRVPVSLSMSSTVSDAYIARSDQAVLYDCREWKPIIRIMVQRRATPWMYNFIVPTFLLVSISVSVFFIPRHDVSGRASIVVTLALTLIALKLSMESKVPVVPYMTLLDKQLITGLVLLCAVLGVVCVASLEHDAQDQGAWTGTDRWSAIVVAAVWVLTHLSAALAETRHTWDDTIREHGRASGKFWKNGIKGDFPLAIERHILFREEK
jgi:hypothetical protein